MMNVREMLPIVIYVRSIFKAEKRQTRTVGDVRHKRVKSNSGCKSVNLLAWLHAAKKLKCWQVSAHKAVRCEEKNKHAYGSNRMKFCCENEHLTVTQSSGSSHHACHRLQLFVITQHDTQIGRLFVTKVLFYPRKSFTHRDGMQNSTTIGVLLQANTEHNKLTRIVKTVCSECKPNGCCHAPLSYVKPKSILSGFMGHFKK